MSVPADSRALPSLVVVPRAPGPLITPVAETPREQDDLDAMLDDLFGKPIQQKPGPLDLGLTLGGLALVLSGLLRLGTAAVIGGAAASFLVSASR